MQIYRGKLPTNFVSVKTAVTVGSFDGAHLGHQAILKRLMECSLIHSELPLAVTFDPHPRSFGNGDQRVISMLYSFDERMDLLSACGIENVFVIDFTDSFRQLSPRAFVEQYVLKAWNAGHVVAGFNHSFGKGGEGDRESLIALGKECGFGVEIVHPVAMHDQIISSTVIRRYILDGEIPAANEMLGKQFSLCGRVVRGFGRGRRMGCPTANLADFGASKIVPRDGIYAAISEFNGIAHPAAVSIGFNPTFGGQKHSVEAHVIDFDGDLYDRLMTVKFVKRLRGEIKFSGEESLASQMQQDISDIRQILLDEGFSLESSPLARLENVN